MIWHDMMSFDLSYEMRFLFSYIYIYICSSTFGTLYIFVKGETTQLVLVWNYFTNDHQVFSRGPLSLLGWDSSRSHVDVELQFEVWSFYISLYKFEVWSFYISLYKFISCLCWIFRCHLHMVSFLHWLHVIFVRFTCET